MWAFNIFWLDHHECQKIILLSSLRVSQLTESVKPKSKNIHIILDPHAADSHQTLTMLRNRNVGIIIKFQKVTILVECVQI